MGFLGGNLEPSDSSPRSTLEREICREISSQQMEDDNPKFWKRLGLEDVKKRPPITNFASEEDLQYIREAVLLQVKPFGDFAFSVPKIEGGTKGYSSFASVYISEPEIKVFDIMKYNLEMGKALTSEGSLELVSRKDIVSGRILGAHAVTPILEYFLNETIQNPYEAKAERIRRIPKDSYKGYNYSS